MRAGSLRHRAEILSLGADLVPASHGSRWVGIRAKEATDAPAASGLRTSAMVEVRARYDAALMPGRYLRQAARVLHITSVRDPIGTGAEVVLSCDELVGQAAEYRPALGAPVPCRAHLLNQAPFLDDLGQVTDYKTAAEVAIIEVGRPQVDDQLLIGGDLYSVIGYRKDSDDGIVRGLWLERA
jgi:hypothetical protein